MRYLTLTLALLAAATLAQAAPDDVQPIEKALKTEKSPNGRHVKVRVFIEVLRPNYRRAMHVKFIDVRPSPAVNIEHWDPKLRSLKPGTILTVIGDLHYGAVAGSTVSIRYKVKEVGGRIYNDHRHWRTDRAIYITDPTWEIRPLTREEILTQPQRDVLEAAREEAAKTNSPAEKKKILAAAEKKVQGMMVGGQMNLIDKLNATELKLLEQVVNDTQKKVLTDAGTAAAAADSHREKRQTISKAIVKVTAMLSDAQKTKLDALRKTANKGNK